MNDRQMKYIMSTFPTGTRFLRAYKALEGDIRVIVRLAGEQYETRYTVYDWDYENDLPLIKLMP